MVRPNMNWLELDITYVCGLNCHNCNRMTGIAPGRPDQNMTVGQVEKLITDSIRLQYPWREWFLVGGEPTTHPDLDAIIGRIGEYRATANAGLELTAATHGNGSKTQKRLAELSAAFPWLRFLNSHKEGTVHHDFVAPCVAPLDIDPVWSTNHRFEGCSVSGHCGISMNYRGFYPCAVAGAIDRIFGLDEAIPDLAAVSEAAMVEKYQVFCRLCGYYRPIRENSQTVTSPAWRAALDRYQARLIKQSPLCSVLISRSLSLGTPSPTTVPHVSAAPTTRIGHRNTHDGARTCRQIGTTNGCRNCGYLSAFQRAANPATRVTACPATAVLV